MMLRGVGGNRTVCYRMSHLVWNLGWAWVSFILGYFIMLRNYAVNTTTVLYETPC